jgi:hypothetical protein
MPNTQWLTTEPDINEIALPDGPHDAINELRAGLTLKANAGAAQSVPQGVNAQLLAAAREAYAAFCFGWRNRNEMGELEAFKQAIAAAEASAPVEAIPRERVRETLTRLRSDWQEELGSYGDDQPGFGTPDEYFEIRGQLHALEVVAAALGIEQEKKGEK